MHPHCVCVRPTRTALPSQAVLQDFAPELARVALAHVVGRRLAARAVAFVAAEIVLLGPVTAKVDVDKIAVAHCLSFLRQGRQNRRARGQRSPLNPVR